MTAPWEIVYRDQKDNRLMLVFSGGDQTGMGPVTDGEGRVRVGYTKDGLVGFGWEFYTDLRYVESDQGRRRRGADLAVSPLADWLVPGRKVVEGYLGVIRGPYKKDYGLLGAFVAGAIEETYPGSVPRYPDVHYVTFTDPKVEVDGRGPQLRYKAHRPIDGLDRECAGHRVRLTCTVTKPWHNGLGAYVVRARGTCIEPGCERAEANEEVG